LLILFGQQGICECKQTRQETKGNRKQASDSPKDAEDKVKGQNQMKSSKNEIRKQCNARSEGEENFDEKTNKQAGHLRG
jgi:hypothetical protein